MGRPFRCSENPVVQPGADIGDSPMIEAVLRAALLTLLCSAAIFSLIVASYDIALLVG